VRGAQHRFDAVTVIGKYSDADRYRDRADQPTFVLYAELLDALPKLLRPLHNRVVRSLGHHQHELFSSIAAHDVLAARRHEQVLNDRAQYRVARGVAERVIEPLEIVDVDHHHAKRAAAAPRPALLASQRLL